MKLHHHLNDSPFSCSCCMDLLDPKKSRRDFLRLAGGIAGMGSLGMLMGPGIAIAGSGKYDAMLLSCIDPRFQNPVNKRENDKGLGGKYSAFTIAGGSIGVVAPAFKAWHETFWQNLDASKSLHSINKVIVVNHRDCGAAKIAYGEAAVATPAKETETLKAALLEFKKQLKVRQPTLTAELGLMSLDGKVESFS